MELGFYSVRGEPIRATLYSLAGYDGTKLSYALRDDKGALLASGNPQGTKEGTPTEINVPVPKPGFYTLKYIDGSSSYFQFVVPASQPVAIELDKFKASTIYEKTQNLYFYVPKGTKEINYYYARTFESIYGPHLVVGPDGTILADFTDKNGDYLSVPVPPGMDGKAWHFASPPGGSFGLGFFHFFNIPDLLGPSPANMLVPREVAEKDGLNILK